MGLIIRILDILFNFMEVVIFIDVILSFVGRGMDNAFTQFIYVITEPLLRPGRIIQEKIMPGLMIDFSPVLALFIIRILREIVFTILL